MTDLVHLRPGKAADLNFILSSWLQSYRIGMKNISNAVYYDNMRPLAMKVLECSSVLIACAPDDEDQILGFVVFRRQYDLAIVSYLYVKQSHRKLGIADHLFQHAAAGDEVTIATHFLPWLDAAFKKRSIVFNPFVDFVHLKEPYGK